ncbi:GDSL-type esterase/lipase family protein [Butyrivibrio proteoclasticus]|uniref:GDSL-type esterase/lipase family protein n=1 Tax=Butyrivibrio proteoclasticus TaxID=43305 RepID=UPI00047898A1|nr:GDSL-type esterase/lipase family protein [Butyrivibrio proteoclasticus]
MKLLKTCPILIGIAVITIALTIVSYVYEDSTYADYAGDFNNAEIPHLVLVFKGATDGVFPWGGVKLSGESDPDNGMDTDLAAGADDSADTNDGLVTSDNGNAEISADGQPGINLSVSDNSSFDDMEMISENDADRTYEFQPVDEDYFTDALFIGDSRTVGLSEYCEPLDTRATFYAQVSLTIYKVMDKPIVKSGNDKISLEQALTENHFNKIYIMLGLNEIGTGTAESFAEEYANVVNRIRELQPDAIIFIQGIMHVTEHKSSNDKYFTNDNINRRNEELAKLADNKTIFYMDMNEAVDDENGNLIKELSFDDVHLKASSYERWYQFLLGHGIVKE